MAMNRERIDKAAWETIHGSPVRDLSKDKGGVRGTTRRSKTGS